ncbi:MAG: Arm DNA-binding domain-containing protein [Raineya sp.]|nr:Arm DNA-binding domain-containing protein [Raineya sp.]
MFWLRKNYVSRRGTCQIVCSISIEGKKIEFGTKLSIEPKNWKQAKQKAMGENSLYINETLVKIKKTLIDIKQRFELEGKTYTLQDIKNAYLGKNQKIEVKSSSTTILQDLEKIQAIRANQNAVTTNCRDKSYFKQFKAFLEQNNLSNIASQDLQKSHLLAYLDNIKAKGNATTYNNNLTWLKAVFLI